MTQRNENVRGNADETRDELRPATDDIEAPLADAFEQTLPVHPEDLPDYPRVGPDVSEADAIEQALLAVPSHHTEPPTVPPEVSEADALEQAQTVEVGEDYE